MPERNQEIVFEKQDLRHSCSPFQIVVFAKLCQGFYLQLVITLFGFRWNIFRNSEFSFLLQRFKFGKSDTGENND